MRAFHDTRIIEYRNPAGIAEWGVPVSIAIDVWDAPGAEVTLRTWVDGRGEGLHAMEACLGEAPAQEACCAPEANNQNAGGAALGDDDCAALGDDNCAARDKGASRGVRYRTSLVPDIAGTIWYQFVIALPDGSAMRYGALDGRDDGEGMLRDYEPPSFALVAGVPLFGAEAAGRDGTSAYRGWGNAKTPGSVAASIASCSLEIARALPSRAWESQELFHASNGVAGLWCAADATTLCVVANTSDGDMRDVFVPYANDQVSELVRGYGVETVESEPIVNDGATDHESGSCPASASLASAATPTATHAYGETGRKRHAHLRLRPHEMAALLFHRCERLQQPMKPGMGVLAHVTSLPGALKEGSRALVDVLADTGVRYWQILPLNPTDAYGSPYAGLSAFAGNDSLVSQAEAYRSPEGSAGLAKSAEPGEPAGQVGPTEMAGTAGTAGPSAQPGPASVAGTAAESPELVGTAGAAEPAGQVGTAEPAGATGTAAETTGAAEPAGQAGLSHANAYQEFCEREAAWLEAYACFTAIRDTMGADVAWQDWPDRYRTFDPAVVEEDPALAARAEACRRRQFAFDAQWRSVKTYANERGVRIVGDMPIYVNTNSADTWAHPELFQLGADGRPARVAGCPPDSFAEEGQVWGNPLYDWDALRKTGYDWWLQRLKRAFELYDFVRLDHFIGFLRYFAIPAGRPAFAGAFEPGPGIELFEQAFERFGPLPIVAEDLGTITPSVRALCAGCGFPGMDVVQFVDGNDPLNWYAPRPDKLVYTGTHDNQTLVGYVRSRYPELDAREIADKLLRKAVSSGADVVVVPLQDILGLDDSARMNTPGTVEGNWSWRTDAADIVSAVERLHELCRLKG